MSEGELILYSTEDGAATIGLRAKPQLLLQLRGNVMKENGFVF